jgi:hypothetical protein
LWFYCGFALGKSVVAAFSIQSLGRNYARRWWVLKRAVHRVVAALIMEKRFQDRLGFVLI